MARIRYATVLAALLLGGTNCLAQQTSGKATDAREILVGMWEGNSICVDRSSPCHDEINVYRFARIAGKPNAFLVTASKVVDGKEVVMGSGEWKYDESSKSVECAEPRIRLTIMRENWMEGVLTLENGREYRKIRLKKAG